MTLIGRSRKQGTRGGMAAKRRRMRKNGFLSLLCDHSIFGLARPFFAIGGEGGGQAICVMNSLEPGWRDR